MAGTDTGENISCPFLKLPGEMRNRIYRLALITDESIEITSTGYERSGLLNTCKKIRSEALKIYYYENTFKHRVRGFDSSSLVKWDHHRRQNGLQSSKIQNTSRTEGDRSWPNLVTWLQHYHAKRVVMRPATATHLSQMGNISLEAHVLAAMFEIARNFRSQSWEQVERSVINMRPSLVVINKKWEQD